jgi:mRNA interferase MazF
VSEISGESPRQGHVYWLDFKPVTGSRPAERHPCVVVQNDVFNRSAISTSVVCLITSNLARANAPGNVLLKKGEASLPKACVVNISQILTVDKTELVELIGKLGNSSIGAVRDGLQLLFDRL